MWFELKGDARLGRCSTKGCGGQPTFRLEADGSVGNYCSGCKAQLHNWENVVTHESFTTSDQLARDIKMGVFPKMSDRSRHELAERGRIFNVVLETLKRRHKGPDPSPAQNNIWCGIARDVAMQLVPTAPAPEPEYNGGDVW